MPLLHSSLVHQSVGAGGVTHGGRLTSVLPAHPGVFHTREKEGTTAFNTAATRTNPRTQEAKKANYRT